MEPKTFSITTSVAMALTLTAAALSIMGIAITGFYPGIIVLVLLAIIPVASKFFARSRIRKSDRMPASLPALTFINVLSALIVLWMSFVIVHDRVLHDCC